MERGQGFASRVIPVRRLAMRPPLFGGLIVALAILGVILWLAIAGRDEDAATDGRQLRIVLEEQADTPAPAEEPAKPDDIVGSEDQPVVPEHDAADSEEPTPPVSNASGEPEQQATGADVAEAPAAPNEGAGGDGDEKAPSTAVALAPDEALAPVDPVLLESSASGPLPVVGPDGRRPWQVYARPFTVEEDAPRLAIIVAELGFNRETTEAALGLPPEVTLSFSPYVADVAALVARARQAGHEVLLDLPMEPASYPADDPGPQALLTSLDASGNIARLEQVLGRAQGYVGVISQMGSKFTTSPEALRPVLSVLAERGLLFVDSKTSATSVAATLAEQLKLPRTANDRFVDIEATRMAIDDGLAAVEGEARRAGVAVGVGRPFPVTLQRLAAWLPTLESRGIALAPVSAVVDRQESP
jgi:polysaccharide deacetylase 2 family uncharacterized protein YibQ